MSPPGRHRDIYARNYHARDIPAENVTHILYSFASVQADGTVIPGGGDADTVYRDLAEQAHPAQGNTAHGCVGQLFELKKAHRHVKVLLSIGGWTGSSNFAAAACTDDSRRRFAGSAVGLLQDWGLDGIDVGWEYPASAAESENMLLLLVEVRRSLDAYAGKHASGHRFLLTMAASAGPETYGISSRALGRMARVVDAVNLMGYDFAGGWAAKSGHQANLHASRDAPDATPFSVDRAVADYVALGVPPDRVVLGMPLYGRSFEDTAGPGRAFSGTGPGSWEAGVWDYKALPRPGAVEAAYSYDVASRVMVSYDNVDTVALKAAYVRDRGLGGSMFWEVAADRVGELSLVATSALHLGDLDRSPNWLDYPLSQYTNIRQGLAM